MKSATRGALERGTTFRQNGLETAISGDPVWRDPPLAAEARTWGHAHALAQAWRSQGPDLLRHLQGSFALAVADADTDRALLAIDRLGREPLCYAATPRGVFFGSTVDTVLAQAGMDLRVDPQALYDYLYFHVVPSPRTIAAGVSKLAPAERVLVEHGTLRVARHWDFSFADDGAHAPETRLRGELMGALEAAVTDAQQGARTGCFLSGGIDSSTIAGLLAKARPEGAHTFTIGFPVADYDEMVYARATIERFHAHSHVHVLEPHEVTGAVQRIAAHFDEPFGNSSTLPAYYCAVLARSRGFERLLAGDGGDELFGGNSRYAEQYVFELYGHVPALLRERAVEPLLLGRLANSAVLPVRKLRRYVEQARIPLPDRMQSYNYFSLNTPGRILHPELLAAIDCEDPLEQLRRVYRDAPASSAVDRMLFLDWKFTLADNDLRKVSRMCALAGVDVRYPWLDDRVLEVSLRIPGHYKVRRRTLRWFAKRALTGFLPELVIRKPKHGFGLPFGVWLKEEPALKQLALDSLATLRLRRIIRSDYIDELLDRHQHEHAHYYGEFVWVLMALELWLQSRKVPM